VVSGTGRPELLAGCRIWAAVIIASPLRKI
jgi:hypothetical protein